MEMERDPNRLEVIALQQATQRNRTACRRAADPEWSATSIEM